MGTREILIGNAKHRRLNNDLFWEFIKYDNSMPEHFIELRWTGYNDWIWWHNVSGHVDIAKQGGRMFRIDFRTNDVYEVIGRD